MRAVVIAVLFVASAARAEAPHVDDPELVQAKELEAKLDYEQALTLVERIIAHGGAEPDKLVELHFMAGKLAAGLDRVDIAENHFAIVLALRPDATMPEGTSPKITMPFDAARGKSAPLRIVAKVVDDRAVGVVEADPLQLVAKQETVVEQGGQDVRAFDVHGNVLWVQHVELLDDKPPPRIEPAHRPLYKRPIFWGGIALGTASIAGLGAWRFSVAQNQWNDMKAAGTSDYTELSSVEDRGRRWGLVANVSLAVALLSTVATITVSF